MVRAPPPVPGAAFGILQSQCSQEFGVVCRFSHSYVYYMTLRPRLTAPGSERSIVHRVQPVAQRPLMNNLAAGLWRSLTGVAGRVRRWALNCGLKGTFVVHGLDDRCKFGRSHQVGWDELLAGALLQEDAFAACILDDLGRVCVGPLDAVETGAAMYVCRVPANGTIC
jgi:hypothetical protein